MSERIFKTDLQYFGSIHFVKTLMENKNVLFDLETPFTKMSFKNRMVIITSQGPLMLTIPIVGGRDQKTPIKDIAIAYDSPWSAQHLKSITTSYTTWDRLVTHANVTRETRCTIRIRAAPTRAFFTRSGNTTVLIYMIPE